MYKNQIHSLKQCLSFPVLYDNTCIIMTLLVEKLILFCLFFDLKLVKYAVGIVISNIIYIIYITPTYDLQMITPKVSFIKVAYW